MPNHYYNSSHGAGAHQAHDPAHHRHHHHAVPPPPGHHHHHHVKQSSLPPNNRIISTYFVFAPFQPVEPAGCADHLTHSMDLVTTLRSELAAANYKRDRHLSELAELRSSLAARDSDAEQLRAQTVRQTTVITSLQTRLQAVEQRERTAQAHSEATVAQLQRDKRSACDSAKELGSRLRRAESDLAAEESARETLRSQLHDLIRRLCLCLAIDVCDAAHLTADTVLNKTAEVVAELQRLRGQLSTTSETLHGIESELLTVKSGACADKQRQSLQLDSLQAMNTELEARARQAERDLQCTRDRLADTEQCGNKLREELRGFESRCARLQTAVDRTQADRLQFLRAVAGQLGVPEPCETLIRERVREQRDELLAQQAQLVAGREEVARLRELGDATQVRLRALEAEKCAVGERLEKAQSDGQRMVEEHATVNWNTLCSITVFIEISPVDQLASFLARLSRSLCWSECMPPDHGADTAALADALLERAERMALYYDHHAHLSGGELPPAHHHHHHSHGPHHHHSHAAAKLRRERSCHDLPLKETAAVYTLQRRVRVLREQVQRRDLHLELVRRKLALLEDTARGKCAVQTAEREEAVQRARRSGKCAEKSAQQLSDARAQLAEVKAQLSEAIDYKIAALERARKIDELQGKLAEAENERSRLQTQVASAKSRVRSAADASIERCRRDEQSMLVSEHMISFIRVYFTINVFFSSHTISMTNI